jgi:NitT/TauT family transport system substrate-binding protein
MFKRSALLVTLVAAAQLAGSSLEAQQKPVRVSEITRTQLFAPLYVAMAKDFFGQEGLKIDLSSANGGDRVGALILSGGADIGLTGPEVPIYIYNSESPDKPVVFSGMIGTDGFFLVSRRKIDNFDWKMLEGKKLFGLRRGTTPQMFFEHLLKRNGVGQATIDNIVTNVALPAREAAWLTGDADFAIFHEPVASKLERNNQGFVIDSLGKQVGRVENTVFFARKSWLDGNAEVAQKFTNAIARAQQWMKTASDEEIVEAIAPYFPGVPKEDNLGPIKRMRSSGAPIFSQDPVLDKAALTRMQTIMVENGVLPAGKVIAFETLVAPGFGEKAKAAIAK